VHPAAVLQLFLIEAAVVMCRGKLYGVMLGEVRLQDDLSGSIATTRASCNLSQELEGALGSAKVWEAQSGIGTNNPYQRDTVNIVSFSDHLSADEQVDLAGMQAIKDALEVLAPAHCIAIKSADPRLREEAMQALFKLF